MSISTARLRTRRLWFRAWAPSSAARSVAEAESQARAGARRRLPRGGLVRAPRRGGARPLQPEAPRRADSWTTLARLPHGAGELRVREAQLADGFVAPELKLAVIPFRRLVHRRRAAAPAPARGRMATFADLRVGDHVVHEDHGIARFAGFETKTVGGVTRDYLELTYRGDDRVFAPTDQLAKITRYVGTGGRGAAALRARAPSAGRGSRLRPAARPGSWLASCSTSTPSAGRAAATRSRPMASGSSRSSSRSRTARPPTSSRRSRPSRRTWRPSGRWTG